MILFIGQNQTNAGRMYWFEISWQVYEALQIKTNHKILEVRVFGRNIEVTKVFTHWTKKIQVKI